MCREYSQMGNHNSLVYCHRCTLATMRINVKKLHETLIIRLPLRWSLTSHATLRVERAKYFKTDQTFSTQKNSLQIRIVNGSSQRAQKSIHRAKYFHFARLVCFRVKLKYIIDSASAAKQLEIHIDMKKRRKIECKNLYFHSITRRKNQHHTRHLLKLRNHES